jgi:hypothetical protein
MSDELNDEIAELKKFMKLSFDMAKTNQEVCLLKIAGAIMTSGIVAKRISIELEKLNKNIEQANEELRHIENRILWK